MAQSLKNLPATQETWVQSLDQEYPLEKGLPSPVFLPGESMDREPGGLQYMGLSLQYMGLQRVRNNWATNIFTFSLTFGQIGLTEWYCYHSLKTIFVVCKTFVPHLIDFYIMRQICLWLLIFIWVNRAWNICQISHRCQVKNLGHELRFLLSVLYLSHLYWVLPHCMTKIKDPCRQRYGFSSNHLQMWELDHKKGWISKNRCFPTVMLEDSWEYDG